jgi:hypothetical protein
MMVVLILIALLVPPTSSYIGIVAWPIVIVAEIAILFVAAWGIDRRRQLGARSPSSTRIARISGHPRRTASTSSTRRRRQSESQTVRMKTAKHDDAMRLPET